ncbi:MAG: YwiC-like family protein [Anaerolineales bacterium]|nr:YwiC-like family protein [Anaerolineales bacterium]
MQNANLRDVFLVTDKVNYTHLRAASFSCILAAMRNYFKRQIALPQDHGSWVFIFSPLLVGFFAGGNFNYAAFNLFIAAMSAFLIRQPLTVAVKSLSRRRSAADLPAARFWTLVYGLISALALTGLILEGFGYVLYLAAPGIPVFAWHLWLVSKRAERRQAGVEVIATGVLALTAPAAYWVGIGQYHPAGWWLWLFCWLQSAASIVYAYLRLGQRDISPEQARGQGRSDWLRLGRRALLYTSFNLGLTIMLGWAALIPTFVFIPFLIQWLETLWGIFKPAVGWKPTRIGVRQLIVSIMWTVFFIICWGA